MLQKQTNKTIVYLYNKGVGKYVTSDELTAYLNVSKRQLQKYIAIINNNEKEDAYVLSSRKGYALNPNTDINKLLKSNQPKETPKNRQNYILQALISNPKGYDIFDLSEELFVSVPTIEADLKKVRTAFASYGLTLKRDKERLSLSGDEKNQRSLMQALIKSTGYDKFALNEAVQLLSNKYEVEDIYKQIKIIFATYEIFANDYAMNNIVLHLIIMIERISNNFKISEDINLGSIMDKRQYEVAQEILVYIEGLYHIKVTDAELYNLALLIFNNSSLIDYVIVNTQNIEQHIEKRYIDITRDLLVDVQKSYHLYPFNEDIITTFAIHIKNVFKRADSDQKTSNPLTSSVKSNYPFIYDIAVHIGQKLLQDYKIGISEDEIAFIAFHIGSYLESNSLANSKISCVFVYMDYYGYHQQQLKYIQNLFHESLNIITALPVEMYLSNLPKSDLVISMVDLKIEIPTVVVNPFIIKKDIKRIQEQIEAISMKKKARNLERYFDELLAPEIFYKSMKEGTPEEIIIKMTQDLEKKGYVSSNFTKDVLAREKMSSTAFDGVAVPHSLSNNVMKSFIAFATFDKPIIWSDKQVSLVALLGINESSRQIFAEFFDYLVEILSNPIHVKMLGSAKTYCDFLDLMTKL